MRLGRARRVLVLGGARSGKSAYAEGLLRDSTAVDYIACGAPPSAADAEWAQRVAAHRARRPASWQTVETLDVAPLLTARSAPVLLDCATTWLAGVMDQCGVWSDAPDAEVRLAERVDELVAAWSNAGRLAVMVSNEVGAGIVPATESGRRFRDEMGRLNARLAAAADRVWLLTAGIPARLR
jgi:adenosylcobinamide kinase/adenosylcobinamide-phosphate guanylyltransferase